MKCAIAYLCHGIGDGQFACEATAIPEHTLGDSLHMVTEAERTRYILEWWIINALKRKIPAIESVELHLGDANTILKSTFAYRSH